jgi:cytochrome c oxidase subunit 1
MTAVTVPPTKTDLSFDDHPEDNYLTHDKGVMSWVATLDHKRIGVMYLCGVMSSFLVGGIFALILRAELFFGELTFLTEDQYNQMFTLHGAIMTFMFIIPGIPAALGNFVLPIMLGAKDVAFPRLNLSSFYLWVGGAIFFVAAMVFGGLDTGWTFYTPYSVTTDTRVILALLGVFVLGFSSIFTGLNFIATINMMRPPGMTWFKMPLLLWSIYSTAVIQVLATPVLAITGVLLILERAMGLGIFDPARGGDPVLFQHFFWFYSHPAVYIMILPAMGVVSELIAVGSRKHIFGYTFIAISSVAIALFGFLVWGHHLFVSSQSMMTSIIFSGLTFSVSIPSAVKVFNWLATMYKGSIRLHAPMCYALSFIFIFSIGGLTGLFLGALGVDMHLHDTYFVVAHFHYVMMGSTAIAFLGGVFYWWPKMTGRMYDEFWGVVSCVLVFLGFNLAFLPQFVMGSRGMPRRYATYDPEFTIFHQMSTAGAFLLGIGLFIALGVLLASLKWGRKAPKNPWGGGTLEWTTTSPPPYYNFKDAPVVGDPYHYEGMYYDPQIGGYVRHADLPAKSTVVHL